MRIAFTPIVAFLLVSCEGASEPTLRRPAWLGPLGDPRRVIQAPDTVHAGVPFSAIVAIAGSGSISCNQLDGASVAQGARVARVEVFVRVPRSSRICTDDIRFYPMSISLTFTTAGNSTIRVVGVNSNDAPNRPDSLERSIVVLP